tara:strand:- start:279 stop:620 length:342 start_codon:yes stop_codon:yes gene_type:complete
MPNVIEFESRRNDDDWRQDVENALSLGYGIFRFQKVDGSIRELMCSLKPELFPEPKGDSKNQSKPGLLTVWGHEEQGFRTIKYDKVINFKFLGRDPIVTEQTSETTISTVSPE